MNVTGLSGSAFYSGNPIPARFTFVPGDSEDGVTVTVTCSIGGGGTSYPPFYFTLPISGGSIDLAPILKTILPDPYVPSAIVGTSLNNSTGFAVFFNSIIDSVMFTNKTLIRGFERVRQYDAVTVSNNTVLKESEKIPMWAGYPVTKSTFIDGGIASTGIITEPEREVMLNYVCDGLYVRFLNTKGGLSYWLFPAWSWKTTGDPQGVIKRTTETSNKSLGFDEDNEMTVYDKVPSRYYDTMKALAVSPMVQVQRFGEPWAKVELDKSSFTEDNNKKVVESRFTFDLSLNNDPRVIW